MSERVAAGQTVERLVEAAVGLTGTLTVEVYRLSDGVSVIGPTTDGFEQQRVAGNTATYKLTFVAPAALGTYGVIIDDHNPDPDLRETEAFDLDVVSAAQLPPDPGPGYATPAELRAEPEVPDTATDAELAPVIALAEDRIEDWLGARPRDPETGRLVVEADVEAWQWTKLRRATVRLAARLFENPDALTPSRYESVSGPDFSKSGPTSPVAQIADVRIPLNASGLRIMGARAVP